jgi:hypothetical protein
MRELRFSTADLAYTDPAENCVLAPTDPLYTKVTGIPAPSQLPTIVSSNKGQIQREQNIKPGTDEWFKLWFSK